MMALEKSAKISLLPGKRGPKPKSPLEQIAKFEKEQREAEMQTALNNPIRRQFGNEANNPWTDSALGRYCLVHKLRQEVFDSGQTYAKTRRKIISAWDGPMRDQPNGTGGDILMETVKGWERDVSDWELAILESSIEGVAVLGWIGELCLDDNDIAPYMKTFYVRQGLLALAVSMGNLDRRALAGA
jgi:hypothetical protein